MLRFQNPSANDCFPMLFCCLVFVGFFVSLKFGNEYCEVVYVVRGEN